MRRINRIEIEGFRSIKSLKLDLEDINVLIGANGSGKSNFVAAFSFLRAITEGRLAQYTRKHGGADRILHFGAKFTDQLRFKVHFKDSVNQYEIVLSPTTADDFSIDEEWAYFWNKEYTSPYGTGLRSEGAEAGISRHPQTGIADYVKSALKSWRVYHFHDTGESSPMKRVAEIDDNLFLRPDGSNIAAFLYLMKEKHSDRYNMIRNVIQRMAPYFDDFVLQPRELDEDRIRLEWRHKSSDSYFDVSSLSDGTLRFICLTTLLCQPNSMLPSVVLLDEPELGLHPYAITLLGSLIKTASQEAQVILSTQSSFLLDQFDPENIIVAEHEEGGTTLRRLEPKAFEDWLEDYSLGQLWEKNELGGRPSGQ